MLLTGTGTGTGQPSTLQFHALLLDQTGQDFAVAALRDEWLALPVPEMEATLDAVALQLTQTELSRGKVNTTMIPFNPVFGTNTFRLLAIRCG